MKYSLISQIFSRISFFPPSCLVMMCDNISMNYTIKRFSLLHAQFHKQNSTYHSLCYTSCGRLDETKSNSNDPPPRQSQMSVYCKVVIASISGAYREGRKEMFYLTTHSTHFIYGYMVSSDSECVCMCINIYI